MLYSNRLNRLYRLALGIIAALSIIAQIVIQFALTSHASDGRIINIAGRQRMLSQRMTKAALAIQFSSKADQQAAYRQELADTVQLWELSHQGLQFGNAELGLPGDNSPTIKKMFSKLEIDYQAMLVAAKNIISLHDRGTSITLQVRVIQKHEAYFLKGMNDIVFQYDLEAQQRVKWINGIEFGLLLLTLTILAIEAKYIFQPAIRQIEQTFEQLETTQQTLKQNEATLEQRVLRRTRRLEAIATLSRDLNTIREMKPLLAEIVRQLKFKFGYYNVAIYLLNPATHQLILTEEQTEAHQKLESGLAVSLGEGIIGTVGQTNQSFLSNRVEENPIFLAHPLLPETRSELAVPLRLGNKLVGVLDIQSNKYDEFNEQDIILMGTVADLITIAIDNVKLLAELQMTILQLQQADLTTLKLQQADNAKSRFITMISHELRTPLNAINGFAELLLLGLSGDLTETVRADVELIYKNGQHLTLLINDVLDITQIEQGVMQINVEPIEVKTIIQNVVDECRSLAKKKSLKLSSEVPETLPTVQADPTRLKQILFNLIHNAIKFTAEGWVKVSVELVQPDDGVTSSVLRFWVMDSGIGIAEKYHHTVFDSYQQADMSDARQFGGLGLGLSICKQLVQLHHGDIGVTSHEGEGAKFWFTIPVN